MSRIMTYEESAREVLAYFEVQHRKKRRADIEDMAERALTDSWTLGQLHLRSINGDYLAAEAIERSPEIQRRLPVPAL